MAGAAVSPKSAPPPAVEVRCDPALPAWLQAVDIWAFGVLLWELYHGARAWAGLSQPQVMAGE